MAKFRSAGLVVVLALLLAVAGCSGSDDDSSAVDSSAVDSSAVDSSAVDSSAVDSSAVVKHGTDLTIARDQTRFYHGEVLAKVKECADGRRVLLFEQRPGRDRELGAAQSKWEEPGRAPWGVVVHRWMELQRGARIYAKAIRKEGSGYVCRPDRSKILLHLITDD